jgi:hypothetical protein
MWWIDREVVFAWEGMAVGVVEVVTKKKMILIMMMTE